MVTDFVDGTIYSTVPEWYSALPTAVRKFKEDEASAAVSAYDAINGAQGVTTASGLDTSTTIAVIAAMAFNLVVMCL